MVKKIHFDLMVLNSVFSFPDLVKQQFMGLEILILTDYRRSRPEVFCKQSVLQIFEEITGKQSVGVSFWMKLQALGLQLY